MNETSKLRIRSAMVIYELERELSRYIRERKIDIAGSEPGKQIVERIGVVGNASTSLNASIILENSYISEALQLAAFVASDTSHAVQFKRLRNLCDALELFDIRNAVSHPNRNFPECYWYRCCTIATDPAIESLGFFEVSHVLSSAISGKLEEPPEEWLARPRWTVPALLPTDFEHSATGLIGRRKDIDKLTRELKNPRAPLISIVARGGIGKTSLVLQVLADFCISAESAQHVDGVVFVSLKQERLTSSGIETLDAPQSISELKSALTQQLGDLYGGEHSSLADAFDAYKDKRTWLFIDNLETLLRDNPSEFTDLYDELPSVWKVIVTSRIPVDGAKNIPLPPLDEGGAVALARSYFAVKGIDIPSPDTVERIISVCDRNPLAVRLTIDYFSSGHDIDTSLGKTNDDVAAFSFLNLLEVLSVTANDVLEALFVIDEPNRAKLCDALSIDMDEASRAISELARTSLIVRRDTDSGEVYGLGTSIRDLLRSSPRNIKVRSNILNWLSKSEAAVLEAMRLQTERKISQLDPNYIPPGTSASMILVAKEVVHASKVDDFKRLTNLEFKLRQQIEDQGATGFRHRLHARVLLELDDRLDAEKSLRAAIQCDPADPCPKLMLAGILLRATKPAETESIVSELIEQGWGESEKAGNQTGRLWGVYLHSLIYQDKLDLVFSLTQSWKTDGDREITFGAARTSAYRRQADKECRSGKADATRVWKLISNALSTIDHLLHTTGASRHLTGELKKLIGDIAFYIRKNNFEMPSAEQVGAINNFCIVHLQAIRVANSEDLDSIRKAIPLPPAESRMNDRAGKSAGADFAQRIQELAARGYKIVTIRTSPKIDPFPSYLFANDSDDRQYYLNVSEFEGGNWKRWVHFGKNTKVAIKFAPGINGRASAATEIVYIG
jgi:hypothetical protein